MRLKFCGGEDEAPRREAHENSVNPGIRRHRQLLHQALVKLLKKKDFDKISVQDIADTATVNRVTFYDHYTDKFALLECVVASRFNQLLAKRKVSFDGTCSSALSGIVLAVCDYLAGTSGPHLESAVIAVVRRMILDGLKQHPWDRSISPEMVATTASWAIYGAAQEWVRTPKRPPSEDIVGPLVTLVAPLLGH